jgi:outer membrane immunogenic protein
MRHSPSISFVAIGLLLGLNGVAAAAPAPPPLPTWTWSGFYSGANVGFGWGQSKLTETFIDSATGAILFTQSGTIGNINGGIGGIQGGYNWQLGNFVAGIEADLQAAGESGTAGFGCGICSATPVATSVTEKLSWFGTVRPRFGWSFTPTTMVYVTGGLAYGQLTDSGSIRDAITGISYSFSKVSAGWTVGAGIEGQLSGRWTWKLEYLFMELQEPSGTIATPIFHNPGCVPGINCIGGNGNNNVMFDPWFTNSIVRVGINYKW